MLTGWPHPRQLHASAEQIPLAEAAFDLVISEYDASIRCDPCAWVPGGPGFCARGQLIFLVNSVQIVLT
jgi:hypothetical protein